MTTATAMVLVEAFLSIGRELRPVREGIASLGAALRLSVNNAWDFVSE